MHCVDYIDVFVRLAKSSDINRVKKPYFDSDSLDKWIIFYEVEQLLVVLPTMESHSPITPKLIEFYGFIVRLEVCEHGIHPIAFVKGVSFEMITCDLKIYVLEKFRKWIAKPQNIGIL